MGRHRKKRHLFRRHLSPKTPPQSAQSFENRQKMKKYKFLPNIVCVCSFSATETFLEQMSAPRRAVILHSLPCPICQKSLNPNQALAVHSFRVHQIRKPVRRHIYHTLCCACLLELHTRDRVLAHIVRSPACHAFQLEHIVAMSAEEADALDAQALVVLNRHKKLHGSSRAFTNNMKCYRYIGPLPIERERKKATFLVEPPCSVCLAA